MGQVLDGTSLAHKLMPEYIVAIIISACVGSYGWLARRIEDVDRRVDTFEVKVAKEYVTKDELANALSRLEGHFVRLEEKFDQHVISTPEKIASLIQSYRKLP